MNTAKLVVGGILVGLAGTLAALKLLPAPFVWIGIGWAVVCLVIVARSHVTGLRLAALGAAAVAFALGVGEALLWLAHLPPERPSRDYTPRPYVNDSTLGWRLVPGQVTRATARLGDSMLYDVKYSADSLGHRLSFPDRGNGASPCALFFVCSFTFGEGVGDEQTLPYRVGALTQGRVRAVNLGVPGYGAEHMLASIERGMTSDRLPCVPTHIIYQALPHHVVRAAGRADYSRHGPRYAMGPDGILSYLGTAPPDTAVTQRGVWFELDGQLRKARLYRLLRDRQPRPGSLDDLRVYLAIVRRSRDLFAEHYPKAEFHVLTWSLQGSFAGGYEGFRDSLARIVPTLHEVRAILPNYQTDPERYQINRLDAHPNPLAYDLLARYVVDSIVRFSASAPTPHSTRPAAR